MSSLALTEKGSSGLDGGRPAPTGQSDAISASGASAYRLRTYIVEDNAIIRENLVATLEELAHVDVVGTATDEWTAVQWLLEPANTCDLAIVDIFLHSGSGLGVLRTLASVEPRRRLVVLSNYATGDIRRKCLELGADGVFDKSTDIDALLQYCSQLAAVKGGRDGTSEC